MESKLFDESSTVYLITQVGISELRNSNRLINRYFSLRIRSLQIVLNRYTHKALLFDDAQIAKALTRPPIGRSRTIMPPRAELRTPAPRSRLKTRRSPWPFGRWPGQPAALTEDKKKKGFSLFRK